jgi:ornithine cyclodeaminase/alanine dehydrogenase-like protein (mu-crystallin family)
LLLLSGEDIKKSISMSEAIDVMEEAFLKYSRNEYIMPERTFSAVKDEDNLLIMPCFVEDCIGLKVVTSYPSNRMRNSPVTQGLVLINDLETGNPLSMMNGTILTAVKTAAVSGVAMRHLKKDAKSIGLIGTGLQGLYQLEAAITATSANRIYLFNRSPEKIRSFIHEFRELTGSDIEISPVADVRLLIDKADIIITATTSLTPVLPNDETLYDSKLVVGVGSYKSNMREFSEALFRRAETFIIDSIDGKRECGDIIDPISNGWVDEENVILLSDLLSNKIELSNQLEKRPLVFKSVSMALFDACIGNYVYKRAKEIGQGTKFEI